MRLFYHTAILILCFCFCKCQSQTRKAPAQKAATDIYTFGSATADGIGKFYFGREIAHVMGATGAGWLERSSRQQEENAAAAIEKMSLSGKTVVADIGAGSGYYTFKISAKIPQGTVYAVDIQDEMISLLNTRKQQEKANNVQIVKGSDTTTNLPPNNVDFAIMVDVYHELEFPREILQSIRRSLTDTGKLLLIEYRGEDPDVAIKPLHKTTVAQLNKEMSANGFVLSYKGDFLPIQHFLIYNKTSATPTAK